MTKTVAFLATGDEITSGDTLDTNSPDMAHRLADNNIKTGMHMHVSDDQDELEAAMQFLLKHHDGLIIIGGLGPTSDDRTRYALANAINRPLQFNEASWQRIENRFKRFRLNLPSESNKRQAYFPQGSTIIPNDNGSADGCWLNTQNQFIALLPGPPSECLPMFDNHILPTLEYQQFQQDTHIKRWLLFGVSESAIADYMDELLNDHPVTTAYRLSPPYIEFKIYYQSDHDLHQAQPTIEQAIQPYLLSSFNQSASTLLKEALTTTSQTIYIRDEATRGHFFATLTREQLFNNIVLCDEPVASKLYVHIEGLEDYWHNTIKHHQLPLTISIGSKQTTYQVPYRQQRTLPHAIELIAHELLQTLT